MTRRNENQSVGRSEKVIGSKRGWREQGKEAIIRLSMYPPVGEMDTSVAMETHK